MKKLLIILVAIVGNLVANPVYAAQTANVTLTWDSNTENDIAKYIISRGVASGIYDTTLDIPHLPGILTQTGKFSDLTEGQTYFFAAQACDTSGNCSGFSNEVSKIIAIAPGVPGNLGVSIDIQISVTIP